MGWDPVVLRKYNTTGHFRLLNQLRGEIRDHPLIRPGEGETVGAVNRSRSLIRAIEARAQAGMSRSRRAAQAMEVRVVAADALPERPAGTPFGARLTTSTGPESQFLVGDGDGDGGGAEPGFRARLRSIDLR
ncbi:MAG: hypothetical protein ACKOXO_02590 [Cyanobium sp.]